MNIIIKFDTFSSDNCSDLKHLKEECNEYCLKIEEITPNNGINSRNYFQQTLLRCLVGKSRGVTGNPRLRSVA